MSPVTVANGKSAPHTEDESAETSYSHEYLFATPCRKEVQTVVNVANPKGDTAVPGTLRPPPVRPLPGVLDHRTFERIGVDVGRCSICNAGKAVYRSREAQATICEGCYVRLVREWNREMGVV